MRRPLLALAALAAAFLAPALVARAGDKPPPELPKPATTPLPKFDNPLHDCEVGETLFYKVREIEKEDGWVRYFEERVLARTKDRALIETVETNAAGTSVFQVDNDGRNTGWRAIPETLLTGPTQKWLADKQKDEILYVGVPATKALRTMHRFLEEPEQFSQPEGPKRVRQIWYTHELPCTGRAKMFPAQRGGERMVLSWEKRLSPEECAKRAARYPDNEEKGSSSATGGPEGGMDEPGMGEPGMEEPGMGEPGMEEPGMSEPGMEEPGMGEPGMEEPGMSEPAMNG